MLEFVKDIAGYEAFHSPPGQIAIAGKLLQEMESVHHILREVRGFVLGANLWVYHGADILSGVHEKLLDVLRVELPEESDGAGYKWRAVQWLSLWRLLAQEGTWEQQGRDSGN